MTTRSSRQEGIDWELSCLYVGTWPCRRFLDHSRLKWPRLKTMGDESAQAARANLSSGTDVLGGCVGEQ